MSSTRVASPVASSGEIYRGPITQSYVFSYIVFAPPGTRRPVITWQQALASCHQLTGPACDNTRSPTITLALVTTPNSGHATADGTLIPLASNALAYVLTWPPAPCMAVGPMGATPRPQHDCTTVAIVDARTGKGILGASG